jgi:hypothetical protein
MTQQLRLPALVCLVVMASAVSGQDAGLFGAPKKSNFEALLDKLPKVNPGNAQQHSCHPLALPPTLAFPGRLFDLEIVIAASL